MAKRKTVFDESAFQNNATYTQYYNRLTELSVSMFEWRNLPETVDPRYLELSLFALGMAVFFKDDVLGYLGLKTTISGPLNVYRIPTQRRAYADNGYNRQLSEKDSVIIFNNMLHTNSVLDVKLFARRLADIDRTIDVNARAQKTPVLIACSENERLTMENLYKEFDGNAPVIYGDKNLTKLGVQVLNTGAPYVADKLYELKTQIWNEALTYLGISNITVQSRERLVVDQVARNQGGVVASRYSRLESRRKACEEINRVFGLDVWCDFREDFEPELRAGQTDVIEEVEEDV